MNWNLVLKTRVILASHREAGTDDARDCPQVLSPRLLLLPALAVGDNLSAIKQPTHYDVPRTEDDVPISFGGGIRFDAKERALAPFVGHGVLQYTS